MQNHGTQNHAENDPDSAITSGSVPSVQDLTGEYTADGKVRFTWVNPSPKDGDSYAWSLVGDSGTDPNAQGTTTESTSIEIDPADGAQTCVQVSLVRADRQMSENPMIACAAKPDAGDMNRYEPIQPGMHAGKQVGACGWMRGQAKFGHNQGRASR